MTNTANEVNAIIEVAKTRLVTNKALTASAFADVNGKNVVVTVTRVNTQTKENQARITYKVAGKVVAAAKVIATIEA